MAYKKGYEEETFLENMSANITKVEFLAQNCTKIYVWHTKTYNPEFRKFKGIPKSVDNGTNLGPLNKYWCLYIGNRPCGFRWKEQKKEQKKEPEKEQKKGQKKEQNMKQNKLPK